MTQYHELGIESVLDALLESRGLQSISDEAADALGNPFWIVDMDSRQLTSISGETRDERLLMESQMGYTESETVRYVEAENVHGTVAPIEEPSVFQAYGVDHRILTMPVMIERIPVAYINSIDEHHAFTEHDFDCMRAISKIVATELEKNELYRNNKEIMFSYFLSDLLENRILYEDIDRRISVLGYSMKKYCYLLNVALPNTENRRIILRSISAQISVILKNSIGCFYEDHYLYFFSREELLKDGDYTLLQLQKFLRETRLKAAISDAFHSIALTQRNYQKTQKALELGQLNNPDQVLYHYSELVVEHALTLIGTGMTWSDFSGGAVDLLLAYDKEHHSALLETLRAFLSCVCRISRAAAILHIHENTVRQRLQKIQDITGANFDSGSQVFELFLALRLYDRDSKKQ